MRLKPIVIASMIAISGMTFVFVGEAQAQALPNTTFIAPVYKTGALLAEGITQTMIRRGFAANDPRIAKTIAAVSTRAAATAAAAGTGATMLATVARLSPYVTAGLLIYQGVTWYLDQSTGKVSLQAPGSNQQPVYSNGIQSGQLAWTVQGGYWGSPEEAISYLFSQTIASYPDAVFSNVQVTSTGSSTASISYSYSYPSSLHISGTATKTANKIVYNGITCPAGSGFVSGINCTSAGLTLPGSGFSNAPVQSFTPQQAYDNLPSSAKDASLSLHLASDSANRLWRDAAAQPDFQGVPWSASQPNTPADFEPYQISQPNYWPKTSDWGSTPVPLASPVSSPETSTTATPTAPSSATKIDFGTDPGSPNPTLEDTPSDLFKPIKDLLQPWLSWQVPAHAGVCPTWQASPSIAGHVFSIDLSYHCTFVEQYRSAVNVAAIVCWLIIAAFIILAA